MARRLPLLEEDHPAGTEDGFGALQTPRGCLPLVALEVEAKLVALTSEIKLRQTFHNPLNEPLEATYIFPLPDRAAVTSFQLRVADRIIDGILKERGEARREYDQAIQAGHRAAIAEEERSGTFSMRLGNLPPKETAVVELTLVGPLVVADGEATFRFPLVVAPRYIPGIPLDGPQVGSGTAADTDQVPDASRISPPVLLPGFPNPVRLSLSAEIDPAGLATDFQAWQSSLRSSLHAIKEEDRESWPCRVSIQPGERLNRDFILRYHLADEQLRSALVVHRGEPQQPKPFALTFVPPKPAEDAAPKPRDVAFVLDRSGSMHGWKIVAARRALGRMIDTLNDQDRFLVTAFDHTEEYPPALGNNLAPASNRNRWRTLEWLGKIDSAGGTEMAAPLENAVKKLAQGENGRERILVLVTDGQVGGEDAVLKRLQKASRGKVPRIFTLGIDRAVNAGFLNRLAALGAGHADLVESEDRLDAVMQRIHRHIASPVLQGIQVRSSSADIIKDSIVPSRVPDLFEGSPLTLFGQILTDQAEVELEVTATTPNGQPWQQVVTAKLSDCPALVSCWGRGRVRELEDQYAAGNTSKKLSQQIVEVSLSTNVLSRFTAYVAVDRSEVVNAGGQQQEVTQPVEMPEGWEAQSSLGSMPAMEVSTDYQASMDQKVFTWGIPEQMDASMDDSMDEREDTNFLAAPSSPPPRSQQKRKSRRVPEGRAKSPDSPKQGMVDGLMRAFGWGGEDKQAKPSFAELLPQAREQCKQMEKDLSKVDSTALENLRQSLQALVAVVQDSAHQTRLQEFLQALGDFADPQPASAPAKWAEFLQELTEFLQELAPEDRSASFWE